MSESDLVMKVARAIVDSAPDRRRYWRNEDFIAAAKAAIAAMSTTDQPTASLSESVDLAFLRTKLKTGDYDGADLMHAWIAIDELIARRAADKSGAAP